MDGHFLVLEDDVENPVCKQCSQSDLASIVHTKGKQSAAASLLNLNGHDHTFEDQVLWHRIAERI